MSLEGGEGRGGEGREGGREGGMHVIHILIGRPLCSLTQSTSRRT